MMNSSVMMHLHNLRFPDTSILENTNTVRKRDTSLFEQETKRLFNPTPYKVSTITATASLTCSYINAELLSKSIKTNNDTHSSGFQYVEFGEKNCELYQSGFHKKLKITRRRRKETKRFDNQVTLLIRLISNNENGERCIVMTNMKVFKNGNVQMTGLKTINQGKLAVQYLIDYIKGFSIDRDILYSILQKQYDIFCTFEACIYPGVKIQYSYNEGMPENHGVCCCDCKCLGKGNSNGPGQCKKVTIAVFQSGSIIITGARDMKQVDEAYKFIVNVIGKHANEIRKMSYNEILQANNFAGLL